VDADVEIVWDVYEQVFLAALDTADAQLAEECIQKIAKQFGSQGVRVSRLIAMKKESEGNYKEAEALYTKILEMEPTNALTMKRQISLRRSSGDVSNAIKMLNEFIKIFPTDAEAWMELADLYLELGMYKQAAFCFEELLLSAPHNSHIHNRYAEILFTMGGADNLRNARKYFAYSYEVTPTSANLKALFGICTSAIAFASTKQGKGDKENSMIFQWAHNKLTEEYQRSAPEKVAFLQAFRLPSDATQ